MYPYEVIFGMSFYEIFVCIGMLSALILADKLGIKKGLSVALQKTLIIGAVVGVVGGMFGAILFQAFYNFLNAGTM